MATFNPFLNPEDIATRQFGSKWRGYDPDEVRQFLRQLADAAANLTAGESDDPIHMKAEILRLKAELAQRQLPQDLIVSETTMIMESARAAAAELLQKAEDNAAH